MQPLILMLGTRKSRSRQEEYRWAVVSRISRFKGKIHQYCRMDSEVNIAFIRQCFLDSAVYPDLNAACRGIKESGIEAPYALQIEHIPRKKFPKKKAAK